MLSDNLTTNEVKNAAGTEEEFTRKSIEGSTTRFARVNPVPGTPHTIDIKHRLVGSGLDLRRESVIRFEKTVAGQVDTTKSMKGFVQLTASLPEGQMTSTALSKDLIANMVSFVASLGASTTILYDGTGNGAQSIINADI